MAADLYAPKWKFTEKLPELTEENLIQRKATLMDILLMHDLKEIMDESFEIPACTAPPQVMFYRKAMASCRQMIAVSIPPDINNLLLPKIYAEKPGKLVTPLLDHLQSSSATDHAILEQQATAITLNDEVSVQEYVRKHRAQRAKMYSAKYPNIESEGTTIRFMIEGMRSNPLFADPIKQLKISGSPLL